MNLITFLNRAKPQNDLTVIDAEMMAFDLNSRRIKKELASLFGSELAKQIFEAARPEFERIRAIIDRVKPGVEYAHSRDSIAEWENEYKRHQKHPDFVATGEIDQFVKKGHQEFAVYGDLAYDISEQIIYDATDDVAIYQCPFKLTHDGINQYINYVWPDEGRGGLATLIYVSRPNKPSRPSVCVSSSRFIYTRELGMTAAQIAGNIVEEVLRGETPLTGGGLPGWI